MHRGRIPRRADAAPQTTGAAREAGADCGNCGGAGTGVVESEDGWWRNVMCTCRAGSPRGRRATSAPSPSSSTSCSSPPRPSCPPPPSPPRSPAPLRFLGGAFVLARTRARMRSYAARTRARMPARTRPAPRWARTGRGGAPRTRIHPFLSFVSLWLFLTAHPAPAPTPFASREIEGPPSPERCSEGRRRDKEGMVRASKYWGVDARTAGLGDQRGSGDEGVRHATPGGAL